MTIYERVAVTVEKVFNVIKDRSPYDTGNLKFNALQLQKTGPRSWRIWVNENIAPYMVYTTEPWKSPRWKGKQNPNMDWWLGAVLNSVGLLYAEFHDLGATHRYYEEETAD